MNGKTVENPKTDDQLKVFEKFKSITTGQTLLTFTAPVEIVNRLSKVYDEDVSTNLTDKKSIKSYSFTKNIFLDDDKKDNYNFIPDYIHEWIKDRIHQYLNFVNIPYMGIKPTLAWINDMTAGEYNEVHRHSGGWSSAFENKVGLSILMGLKIPADMEKNTEGYHLHKDGWTEFIAVGNSQQFVYPTTLIKLRERTCVVFPYDLLHHAYPHFSNQTRRTMSMNIDVFL